MRVPTFGSLRVILSGAKNPFPSGVVGCGVGDAPRMRNDPFHRAVEDAGPCGVGARRWTMLVTTHPFPSGVVGCGVPDAPRKRNDLFHRAVEDAGPYYIVSIKTLQFNRIGV